MKREIYYRGTPSVKYGIWNTQKKCWQFGICEDTPMLAEERLFQKIGDDARKWRFEPRPLPRAMWKHAGRELHILIADEQTRDGTMKRLTKRQEDGTAWYNHQSEKSVSNDDLLERLAAYEEIGLLPEEVKALRYTVEDYHKDADPLLRAKAEGRIVVLPVARVFALEWDVGPTCDLICPVTIDGRGQCHICDHGRPVVIERACTQADIPYIGKTVSFTHEEAEVVRVSEMNTENGGGAENECDKRSGDVAD